MGILRQTGPIEAVGCTIDVGQDGKWEFWLNLIMDRMMPRLLIRIACWTLSALLSAVAAQSGASQDKAALQAASHTELVDGDLELAIQQFEAIAGSQDRAIAVQALQGIAACYEKMRDRRAVDVYERIVAQFPDQKTAARDAAKRLSALKTLNPGTTGWYNGDWQAGIPGLANRFTSPTEYSRVYDDFVVPEGGWTVVGLYSNNHMNVDNVSKAAWEIRKDMAPGDDGKGVAAGTGRATQTRLPGPGRSQNNGLVGYRIQVNGIRVRLAPGRYWLNVAPCIGQRMSYIDATLGKNAFGDPLGNNGMALFLTPNEGVRAAEAAAERPGAIRHRFRLFSRGNHRPPVMR